jgi:integrase
MAAAGLERPRRPLRPRYIEHDAEMAKVLGAAATPNPKGRMVWPERDIALAALLVGTGMRAGELCGLRIRDLVLDVEDSYVRVTGKGGAVRDCPLAPQVATTLLAYLASRDEQTRRRARWDDPVWLNNHGNPPHDGDARPPRAEPVRTRRGCTPEGSGTHAFRHTVAMQLVNRGEPVTVVQALLGHASLSSTQIYVRAAGHHVREATHILPVRQQLRKVGGG